MSHTTPDDLPTDSGRLPEVPDFTMLRPIGSGGFGQVWLATNRITGQLRAIKVISLQQADRAAHDGAVRTTADRARREITSITRLEECAGKRHPNLMAIHHVGRTSEWLFYVMDPADDVSGHPASELEMTDYYPATLQSRLQAGIIAPAACLEMAHELLAGLASLHATGMVHRDVKPANCLFVDGVLKLADFGLVAEASPLVSRVGTQKYMPPDGRMDTRADVYAAGLVLYEMITRLPVDSFPHLGERAAGVAADTTLARLNRVILRACQPDPRQRFADATAMLAAIDATNTQTTGKQATGITGPPLLASVAAVTGACLVVALAVMAADIWWPSPPQSPPSPHASQAPAPVAPAPVAVNFITEPDHEAMIWLDGRRLLDENGQPFRTPCTVADLPSGVHRIVFKHDNHGPLDAGEVDFTLTREIVAQWPSSDR